jgi:hypothetical protein
MKTHELAKGLSSLSKILRSLPNQELSSFGEGVASLKKSANSEVGISLSTLAAFSKYSKGDWQKVISDFDLPLQIRPRDASRDVMGKILTYLADNESERRRIASTSQKEGGGPSELSSALSFLLNNG